MRKFITLSAVAAMAVSAFASEADLQKQIDKLSKELEKTQKQLTAVKIHDAGDNIKFDVDFRTSVDMLNVETASGAEFENDALMANRLWLGMGYALNDNMVFKGQISYNKAFGAAPSSPATGYPQRGFGYDTFDWVVNENLTDNTLKLREAYWLYMTDSLGDSDVSFTASIGRRPSTNGFLANLREDDNAKSPLGHVINVEFDGASFKFGLGKITGVPGMYWKLCLGRGLSNARARFNMDGGLASLGDYTADNNTLDDIDMAGFIFVPYDDGQYRVETTWYRGFNVPGFNIVDANYMNALMTGGAADNTGMLSFTMGADGQGNPTASYDFNPALGMKTMGDQDGAAISVMVDGIGDGISDFLDDTKFFASYGWSKTNPNNDDMTLDMDAMMAMMMPQVGALMQTGMSQQDAMAMVMGGAFSAMAQGQMAAPMRETGMLGSADSETGSSVWVGVQFPALITEDGRIGLEYNHGSEYWRPFTYGEDTMVASKLAARGDAYEAYWTQPLMGKAFTMQVRYTYINYDYTGSQGFFGDEGAPYKIEDALAMGMDPVEKASDLRVYFRYRY